MNLDAYLDLMDWQLEHIQEGIRQADRGEFASEEETAVTFAKWKS
ncbi:hypothetical protein FACS1894204_02520 [Synergistales bacterium]|nr:hypothetical protein AGMMS49957_11560 [Synergistales bacterium]GHS89049.1 hypothetical protein AGMMS49957_11600 [Synergistales bacterium]GHV44796.1 hypothetical protein FACS1894204_02520 [Synergistales bacterium]